MMVRLARTGGARNFSCLLWSLLVLVCSGWAETVRVKDVARWKTLAANPLVGYGLVVGLNDTGDRISITTTNQTVANMLKNFGVFVPPNRMRMRNTAVVMVTADLPPSAKVGDRFDVLVSSLGDADSLEGGTLLLTPLFAADNEVYAEAQGPISIGGFNEGIRGGTRVKKNHPTSGWVPAGGVVVKDAPVSDISSRVVLSLKRSDFSLAAAVEEGINRQMGEGIARTLSSKEVELNIPVDVDNKVAYLAQVEQLPVQVEPANKVVVNEKTGTVIIGGAVRISPVAIAHGALEVVIGKKESVSQPLPLSPGKTKVVQQVKVKVKEEKGRVFVVNETASVRDLASALNQLGATPRDLIAILQGLKKAGALQADVIIW